MATAQKRPRKVCNKCKLELSDRHFRRHVANCTFDNIFSFQESTLIQNENDQFDSSLSDDDLIFPSKNDSINYEKYVSTKSDQLKMNCGNIDDDDAKAFFDIDLEITDESFDSSEYESNVISSTDEEENDVVSVNDCNTILAQFICTMLILWQSIYSISDAAIESLLKLFKTVFQFLKKSSSRVETLVNVFPQNVYAMSKFIDSKKIQFLKYVVCRKCFKLYKIEDCHIIIEGRKQSKLCNHICFPNHKLAYMRRPCSEPLLKDISETGSSNYVPYKVYCYKTLKSSLEILVNREHFEDKCEIWRIRHTQDGMMQDVYDGNIWKDFNGRKYDFLTQERNYALMLNVDWFQPFKHTNYSVGAIYISFLNLPREERFKRENIILIGIIPDMKKEPPTNSFLQPLVDELNEAWHNGILIKSRKSGNQFKRFRLALLCVGCAVPASRKLCGFYGHMANLGCNKCEKQFPGMIGEKTFGGFDRRPARSNDRHRQICRKITKCSSKLEKEALEKKHGIRVSCLLDLDYFDPVRMTPIDPMHNLFLGTAKHMIKVWKTKCILNENDFLRIQDKVGNFLCPSDVGKLPKKFASSFGSFNADQWKNWTLLFSIYALKDILPPDHLECWRKFVLACRRLCSRNISMGNVKVADFLLLDFCKTFEQLYGENFVTPNMHLHGHLLDCLFDFGPIYSFWLFSFERENGILGSYLTNRKQIETQVMKKYLKESWARENQGMHLDDNCFSLYEELSNFQSENARGTLFQQCKKPASFIVIQKASIQSSILSVDWSSNEGIFVKKFKCGSLSEIDLNRLNKMYSFLYGNDSFQLCTSVKFGNELYLNGSVLGSKNSRSIRSSFILAFWSIGNGQLAHTCSDLSPHPGQIVNFVEHSIIMNGTTKTHFLAKVNWFKGLDDSIRYYYGKPVEVWYKRQYEQEGPSMYIPVHGIKSKFVYATDCLMGKDVIVVCPRERYLV